MSKAFRLRLRHVKVEQAAWKWRLNKEKLDLDLKSYRSKAWFVGRGKVSLV